METPLAENLSDAHKATTGIWVHTTEH